MLRGARADLVELRDERFFDLLEAHRLMARTAARQAKAHLHFDFLSAFDGLDVQLHSHSKA